jgi:[ribosomal protein S18]-alanine N-acetyltransferase
MSLIRPYISEDKRELVALLKLNTPQYFDAAEESDFIDYLENQRESYFVVELGKKIIGCGGINYFADAKLARISWDIIHPDHQGKGIGKKLILYRIDQIKNNSAISAVEVRTTQLAYKFYQKMGFELERVEKDFWAKGFDLYQMTIGLNKTTVNH